MLRYELEKATDFFLEKGDLSQLGWVSKLQASNGDLTPFDTVGRVLAIDSSTVEMAWEAAWDLQTLHEGELLDGGDGSETRHVSPLDLVEDYLSQLKNSVKEIYTS